MSKRIMFKSPISPLFFFDPESQQIWFHFGYSVMFFITNDIPNSHKLSWDLSMQQYIYRFTFTENDRYYWQITFLICQQY
jgi:hypothetical protein